MALLGALGHLANLGQFAELAQGHTHQKEQVRWSRRNFALDAQALKIDLLGAARSDVRGTYDTYVERLDSLLLLNALLLPFALNTLQFSDQFVPGLDCYARADPHTCVEVRHPWAHTVWVYLVAIDLIVPFWSILLLLGCKSQLDAWLQTTQDDLQDLRRSIIVPNDQAGHDNAAQLADEAVANEQQCVVETLGAFIVDYQDQFMAMWDMQCAPLVFWATRLLWSAATVAIVLTAYMFWIYLADLEYNTTDHLHFAVLTVVGLCMPVLYSGWHRYRYYRCHVPGGGGAAGWGSPAVGATALSAPACAAGLTRVDEHSFVTAIRAKSSPKVPVRQLSAPMLDGSAPRASLRRQFSAPLEQSSRPTASLPS